MKMPAHMNTRIQKTDFEILDGDITEIEADVIVSSDDVFLTMGGGVSCAIRRKAGESLLEDTRKQELPIPIADIVVTTAGRLSAKYIFHATTLDFESRLPTIQLLSTLIKRMLIIGNTLKIKHIALPLLGAGTAGLSQTEVLKIIARSIMYELASENYQINKISLVLFSSSGLVPTINELTQTALKAQEMQWKIDKMQSLLREVQDDDELKQILETRIEKTLKTLQQKFHIDGLEIIEPPQTELSILESGKKTREKLEETIVELDKEIDKKILSQESNKDLFSDLKTTNFANDEKVTTVSEHIQNQAVEINNLKRLREKYKFELKAFHENQLQYRSDLLEILSQKFNSSELRTLSFYLDVDYENLPGESKIDKARELLVYLKRRGQINALQIAGSKMRPDMNWPAPPSD